MISDQQRLNVFLLILLTFSLGGCKPAEEPHVKSIVGAVLMDGTGGPPISDSVVTIEGSQIRAVGNRASLPVPADAEKIDGSGKFLVPGLVDLDAPVHTSAGRQGIEKDLSRYLASGVTSVLSAGGSDPATVRQAERQGGLIAARLFLLERGVAADQADAIEMGRNDAGDMVDAAHKYRIPAAMNIFSLADAHFALDNGASIFLHMIPDTDAIEPAFLVHLRDLRIVCVPVLEQAKNPAELDFAKRNTKRLFDSGVLIGAGSGGDLHRELELLAEAGLSPGEILLAATRNNAMALRQSEHLGSIEPGKLADLLLVSANPAEDVRNLRAIDRVMLNGQWMEKISPEGH